MDKQAVEKIKDDIINAALPHVAFDGWSWDVVEAAAAESDYDKAMARAVFPSRMTDVLDGFSDLADRWMMEELDKINPDDLRIRDRVGAGVIKRLERLDEHKEAVRKSLAFWIVPFRKPRALKIVWRSADLIWSWAGDTSTDYNKYTKRGLLSGVILSTTLAWINDQDCEMKNTQVFLDKRIENVMQLGKVIGKVKSKVKRENV